MQLYEGQIKEGKRELDNLKSTSKILGRKIDNKDRCKADSQQFRC